MTVHLDIETVRALNLAARGASRWKQHYGRAGSYAGRVVFCGRPNLPYGAPTGPLARFSHVPTLVYTAWLGGRLVGSLARWRCGASSRAFVLSETPERPVCHLCAVRQAGVTVIVSVAA